MEKKQLSDEEFCFMVVYVYRCVCLCYLGLSTHGNGCPNGIDRHSDIESHIRQISNKEA